MRSIAIAAILATAACRVPPPAVVVVGQAPPTTWDRFIDRAADIAAPVVKGALCSLERVPDWLPEGPIATPLLTGLMVIAKAVVCAPPKPEEPVVEVGVEVAPVPVP